MKKHIPFAKKMRVNFLLCTIIPFVLISILISAFYNDNYSKNIQNLTISYISSLARNIDVYFTELEQITFSPFYNQSVIDYLRQLHNGEELDFAQSNSSITQIQDILSFLRFSRNDIQSLVLVNSSGPIYYSTNMLDATIIDDYAFEDEDWYKESVASLGNSVFVPLHVQNYFTPKPENTVFSVSRAIMDIYTREILAIMKIDANNLTLNYILNDIAFAVSGNVYITDEFGNVIYTKEGAVYADKLYQPEMSDEVTVHETLNEFQMIKHLKNGWSLHVLLNKSEMNRNTILIFIVALSLYFIGTMISFYFYNQSSKRLVRAIEHIKHTLLAFEQGDFNIRCKAQEVQEFYVFSDSINHMIIELDKNIKQVYIATIRRKDAELKALKSQIEPHFLFNTLNNLIALSQDSTPEEQTLLERSLYSLSFLLRYVLNKNEEVTLCEELFMLENYCKLQALRFDDRFDFEITTNTDESWGIPRLSLQPFIENSIIHGIEPIKKKCHLKVNAEYKKVENTLEISIVDNGIGCEHDLLESGGIGVSNSIERFKIYYPDTDIKVKSSLNNGCSVQITIPNPISLNI